MQGGVSQTIERWRKAPLSMRNRRGSPRVFTFVMLLAVTSIRSARVSRSSPRGTVRTCSAADWPVTELPGRAGAGSPRRSTTAVPGYFTPRTHQNSQSIESGHKDIRYNIFAASSNSFNGA
jgi:hypothetical protein